MIRGLKNTCAATALLLVAGGAFAADVNVPRIINADTTWTADNTYFLSGYTFVVTPSGAATPVTLTIEPGTVIKGRQKQSGGEAAALVVTRGARINANGTRNAPIVFTSELDQLNGNLGPEDTNLWGGVVILGNASVSSRADNAVVAAPVTDQIEGFSVTGDEVNYITFGGTNDDDNSGVFRYASIRHGGDVVGTANEINGLTMGGVGRGTTIEYVEVFANKDDGFEWFGGTVDARYLVNAFGMDDAFDYDQGWRGRGQFWFTIGTDVTVESMDKAGEHDGATAPLTATPIQDSTVFNATYIGIGTAGRNNTAINARDNASARYYNSVFLDFARMVDFEDDLVVGAGGNEVATAARIDFTNNVWWSHVGANNNAAGFNARPSGINAAYAEALFTNSAFNNVIADPMLGGVSRTANAGLDPRPQAGSPALVGPFKTVPADDWYVQTNYKGAFAPGGFTWMDGWTKLATEGYLTPLAAGPSQKFANISTRCFIGTGDAVAIPGFVIDGPDAKTVLIRAVGPELSELVAGSLVDPVIELKQEGVTLFANDDWGQNSNSAQIVTTTTAVGAFDLVTGSASAVLLVTLPPGAYTVVTSGKNGSTGVALVEVYGVD
ncbi:hypothetical protein ASA1KI_25390 [Opitutales bacterium ASA1]|nr:hypothetical protein ASA1KI_25390 [Opitutales bacterium ASA1]